MSRHPLNNLPCTNQCHLTRSTATLDLVASPTRTCKALLDTCILKTCQQASLDPTQHIKTFLSVQTHRIDSIRHTWVTRACAPTRHLTSRRRLTFIRHHRMLEWRIRAILRTIRFLLRHLTRARFRATHMRSISLTLRRRGQLVFLTANKTTRTCPQWVATRTRCTRKRRQCSLSRAALSTATKASQQGPCLGRRAQLLPSSYDHKLLALVSAHLQLPPNQN